MSARRRVGIAVLGLGWMGQAHSRSALRLPSLFPQRDYDPHLVVCAETEPDRRDRAVADFGFARAVADRIVFMDGGHILEQAAPHQFFDNPRSQRARQFLAKFSYTNVIKRKESA